ncbi:hypothetical protein M2118_000679 [Aurantimicrobium minutum]|uniref:hypothetical protein n=1 Tax=Aurantimicrobium minutum TaxID=708131 RepID=UPI00247539CD|nr:hypothetical protein [Aurantimicrobium minutum]MDH6277716.1 hypothetical protein [Aurantimicrobium minutum]
MTEESSAFFEDELDAFKFRNEMRKRPDYVVKYPDIVGLSSDEFYDRIRQDNEILANNPIPVIEPEEENTVDEQPVSRLSKLKGLFSSPDAS